MVGTTWDKILQGRWIALLWASSVGLNIWKSFDGQRATVMGIPCWDPSQRDYLECQGLRLSVSSVYLSTPHVYFVDLEWFGSKYVSICAMDVSYPDDVWMPCLMGNRRHGESFDRRAMLCFDSGFGWPRPFWRSSGSNRSKQRSGWIRVDWGWLAPICAEAWWEPLPKIHIAPCRMISHHIIPVIPLFLSSPYVAD